MDNQNTEHTADHQEQLSNRNISFEGMSEQDSYNDRPQNLSQVHENLVGATSGVFVNNATTQAPQVKPQNSAGVIVLQWLTYAFWGWTLLAVNWLIFMVVFSILKHQDVSSMIPYAIASVLVLLPISFVCDLLYGKREPAKKTGAAVLVMVVHAVIFALFSIGSLIAVVFNIVQMTISTSNDTETLVAWMVSFCICALLYAFTFLRTLNPRPTLHLTKIYPISMSAVIVGLIVAAFVGPVAISAQTKNDRDITDNLSYVSSAIGEYINENKKLPNSLKDVSFNEAAEAIVKNGLVTYIKEGASTSNKSKQNSASSISTDQYYRYQLCVTYKEKDTRNSLYTSYGAQTSSDNYSLSPYTYGHPAGRVCYKLEASVRQEPNSDYSVQGGPNYFGQP